jgi:ketosteroid isomerase-like protein
MTAHEAHEFALKWIDAWNSHDVERILSHYTDDFEMTSPFVSTKVSADRTVRGKAAARAYWRNGLARVPDMTLRLVDVLVGVGSVALYYHTTLTGAMVVEVLTFGPNGGIVRGHAHYSAPLT